MFDPDFDPLKQLETLLKNQHELARAYNEQSKTLEQLVHQNRQLNNMLRLARIDIGSLRADVDMLKLQPAKEIVYNTNYGNH